MNTWYQLATLILLLIMPACGLFSKVEGDDAEEDLTVDPSDNAVVIEALAQQEDRNCQVSGTFTGSNPNFGTWTDLPARFRIRYGSENVFTVRCDGQPTLAVRVDDNLIPDYAISQFKATFLFENGGGLKWVRKHDMAVEDVTLSYDGDGSETQVGVICNYLLRVNANPDLNPSDLDPIAMTKDGSFYYLFLGFVTEEDVYNCNYRIRRANGDDWPSENLYGQGEADQAPVHLDFGTFYEEGGFSIDWKDLDGHVMKLGEDLNFGDVIIEKSTGPSSTTPAAFPTAEYTRQALEMNANLEFTREEE